MRYKSSIVTKWLNDDTKAIEFIDWANDNGYKLEIFEYATPRRILFEGFEDAKSYKDVMEYLKQKGVEYEVIGRGIVHDKSEIENAEILLCIVNAEVYASQDGQTECPRCGLSFPPDEKSLRNIEPPKKDLVHLVGRNRIVIGNSLCDRIASTGLTGFDLQRSSDLRGFKILDIISRIGFPTELTPVTFKQQCPECKRRTVSFSIDTMRLDINKVHFSRSFYDGSDILLPSAIFTMCPYFIIISHKMFAFLKSEKATGYYVIPAYLD